MAPEARAKVLVVEDSQTNLDILLGLLSDYDAMVALDGPTALEILEREVPDVILLDIVMPGMDGFEVCRRIKARSDWKAIPILFITGKSDESSIIHAFDVGGSDYVTKPFRSKELLARVRIQVEYRRAMEKLRTMAVTDALTGLPNRRAFFADGIPLFSEGRARGRPLAALMIDIDHFKRINDRFGHACGDEVLRRVGRQLRGSLTPHDLCARIGGEEFAVLMPGCGEEAALPVAERLRQGVETLVVDATDGTRIAVTCSIGVAPLSADTPTLDGLMVKADDALYEAKHRGRNRVSRALPASDAPDLDGPPVATPPATPGCGTTTDPL